MCSCETLPNLRFTTDGRTHTAGKLLESICMCGCRAQLVCMCRHVSHIMHMCCSTSTHQKTTRSSISVSWYTGSHMHMHCLFACSPHRVWVWLCLWMCSHHDANEPYSLTHDTYTCNNRAWSRITTSHHVMSHSYTRQHAARARTV